MDIIWFLKNSLTDNPKKCLKEISPIILYLNLVYFINIDDLKLKI